MQCGAICNFSHSFHLKEDFIWIAVVPQTVCTFVERITVPVISLVRTAPGNKLHLKEKMNSIAHKAGEILVKHIADRLFGNGS